MSFITQIKSVFSKKDEQILDSPEITNSVKLNDQPEPEVEIINASGNSFGSYKFSIDNLESKANNVRQLISEYRTIA